MSDHSPSDSQKLLSRRRFIKLTSAACTAVFTVGAGSFCLRSQRSFANEQQARLSKIKISAGLTRELTIADGGVNRGWASASLETAIDCNNNVFILEHIDVRQFERLIIKKVPSDTGTWDWSRAIQAGIDMAEAKGLVCVTPFGVLRITQPLQLGSNSRLYISPGTTILKDFNSIGTYAGTIKNKGDADGVSNVLVFGGGTLKSSAGRIGKHIVFFNSDFITVFDLKIRNTYSDWTTKFQNCNNVLVYGNDTDVGSTEVLTDGWHFKGKSKNIVIANNRVRTGDDCIAFTQEVPGVDESGDVEDVTVVNNYLDSSQSSLIKMHVRKGVSAAIRRVSINNVDGKVGRINEGGFAFYLTDEGLQHKISNVKISNIVGRCEENGDYCARVVGCRDIHIDSFEAHDSLRGVLIENSYRISLDNLKIHSLRGEGVDVSSGITLQNSDWFWITNPYVSGTKQHGIQLGALGKPVSHGVVSGGTLSNCFSTGLRLTNAKGVTVEYVRCYGNKNGIVEDTGSRNNLIAHNDLKDNYAISISVLGVGSVGKGNEGVD
jgi:hypothetical protein